MGTQSNIQLVPSIFGLQQSANPCGSAHFMAHAEVILCQTCQTCRLKHHPRLYFPGL